MLWETNKQTNKRTKENKSSWRLTTITNFVWGIEFTFCWFTKVINDERCKEKEEGIGEGTTVLSKYKMLYILITTHHCWLGICHFYNYLPFFSLFFFFFFFQVIFAGIAGFSFTGDIAIDGVKIIKGGCPGKNKPKWIFKVNLWMHAKVHSTRK